MKRLASFLIGLALLFLPFADIATAGTTDEYNVYYRSSLTGGTADDLDGIDGAELNDLDIAIVVESGVRYIYWLDEDNAGAEASPMTIAPDTNPGNKRWLLTTQDYSYMTFAFTTEANITDPLTAVIVLLDGDDDAENDTIDLQNGTRAGQIVILIAYADIDANDTCTISMADTTCTGCDASIVFDKAGDTWMGVWTGAAWYQLSTHTAP